MGHFATTVGAPLTLVLTHHSATPYLRKGVLFLSVFLPHSWWQKCPELCMKRRRRLCSQCGTKTQQLSPFPALLTLCFRLEFFSLVPLLNNCSELFYFPLMA